MHTPKRYIHDRVVLALLSINIFFAALIAVNVILALTGDKSQVRLIQHRPSLGLSANTFGTSTDMIAFIIFPIAVFIFHMLLSIRVYQIRRHFAIVILGMGTILILLAGIISYYLL